MKKLIMESMVLLLVIGCNQPNKGGVSIAFEELGGEVGSKKGNERTNYRSSVSVSGLGQNQIVGSILTVPGRNIPDTYSIPIITGCSKVAVTEYGTDANETDVKDVRDYLDSFIKYNAELSVVETEQFILKELIKNLNITTEGSAEKSDAKKALISFYSFDDINIDSNRSEILKVSKLKENRLNKQIQNIKASISDSRTKFNEARKKSGLIITNWSRVSDSQNNIALGTITSASGSKNKTRGGYLVLAGIRSESLWLGDDFAMYIKKRKDGLTGSDSILSKHGYIVSFSIDAKYRAYSESLKYKRALFARLNGKIDELANLVGKNYKEFLKKQSLAFSRTVGNMVSSENSGLLSTPKKSLFEYRFINDKAFSQSMIESYRRSDGYLPVYAVRSDIADLKKNISDVHPDYKYECSVYVGKDNRFYNYNNKEDYNKSISCTSKKCSLVDLRNEIKY